MTRDSADAGISLSPELTEFIGTLRQLVNALLRIHSGVIALLIDHKSAKSLQKETRPITGIIKQILPIWLQAVGSSANTLVRLSAHPGLITRDCYGIARTVLEGAVNICYVLAEGERVADQAVRHARQKSYKDLNRESIVGDSVIRAVFGGSSRSVELKVPETIEADIKEFTSKSGRDKGWTELSVDERILAAGEKLGAEVLTGLHISRFAVYRDSSEIIHGTLFGALHFFDQTEPRRTDHDLRESIRQKQMMLLVATACALDSIIAAFRKAYGFESVFQEARSAWKTLNGVAYFRKQSNRDSNV